MQSWSARVPVRAVADVSWMTVTRYLSQALYLVRGAFLARLLGPEAFGIWSSMRLVRRYSLFSPLGSTQGMLQLSPTASGRGETELADHYRRTSVAVGLVASLSFSLGVAVIASVGPGWIAPEQRSLWLVFAAVVLGAQLHELQVAMLRSEQRFAGVGMLRMGMSVCSTILGVGAAWRFGLTGFLVALCVSYAVVLVAPSVFGQPIVLPTFDVRAARELFATGSTILLAQLLSGLLWSVDKLLLWAVVGTRALGIYTVPSYLVNLALLLPMAVGMVSYPRLLEATARTASPRAARPYLERATVLLAHIACPILAFFYLTLQFPIMRWLPDYASAIVPGRILLLIAFFPMIASLPSTVLVSLRKQTTLIAMRALAIVVAGVAVGGALAAGGGLAAVAAATAPGFVGLAVATLVSASRRAELPPALCVRILARALTPYALLLVLVATLGGAGLGSIEPRPGTVYEAAPRIVLVCGLLVAWAVWSTRRLVLLARS